MRLRGIGLAILSVIVLTACGVASAAPGLVSQHTTCPDAYYSGPVWSPDGESIYYGLERGGGVYAEIHAIQPRSGVERRVATQGILPQVSPDGRRLLYRLPISNTQWELYLVDVDGSDNRQILLLEASTGYTSWSPDSKHIAFVDARDAKTADLYRYDLDSGAIIRLTTSPGNDITPVWSPDGTKIAFGSDREGTYLIYVTGADGSGETQLSTFTSRCYRTPHFDDPEAWLPDGSGVAYTRACDDYRVVQIAGLDGRLLADWTGLKHQSQWPEWSPDGSEIVYQMIRNNTYIIRAMAADGSHDRQLASDAWAPRWSPDGRRIVYVSHDPNGHTALFLMDVASGARVVLTQNPGNGICYH